MMTVEFIAQSMAEAIRAISDLRAELEIAYEHLHAAEAERDALAKDAERWRKAEEIFKDMGWKERIIVCKVCDDDKCQEWHRVPTITKAIDAAIDAARGKGKT